MLRPLVLIVALFLTMQPLAAQEDAIVHPLPGAPATFSAGFLDPAYLREIGVQHLGVDLPAPEGAQVVSPVGGTVVLNRTQGVDPLRAYLVIRSASTGHDHVLAHIDSPLPDQGAVTAGDPVGTIVPAGTGPHLHYGINRSGVLGAIDTSTGWGFGQAPATATPQAAAIRGWLDPGPLLAAALEGGGPATGTADVLTGPSNPASTDLWTQALVAGVDLDGIPCGAAGQTDACLRNLGFREQAINFSFAIDGDYSGTSKGIGFAEIGDVDLALVRQIGADVVTRPALVNGSLGLHLVEGTLDLSADYADDDSRAKLARHPKAQPVGIEVISHRFLPDGTLRFTVKETLRDGCRACDPLGIALTFLDVIPDGGGIIRRQPATLYFGATPQRQETPAGRVRSDPILLQLLLNMAGFAAGPVDGYPGPTTRTALMQYQAENCLPPTGQPDPETAALLVATAGFSERCPGTPLPPGITANSPFVPGIYVRTPAQCALETIPHETIFDDMRMIGDGSYMAGYEDGCLITRTDIRNGITMVRGQCFAGNSEFEGRFYLDVLSTTAFAELADDMQTVTGTFTRCAEDSLLSRTWLRVP